MTLDFEAFRRDIAKSDTFRYMGKIEKIVGMTGLQQEQHIAYALY